MRRLLASLLIAGLTAVSAAASDLPPDPLGSVMWKDMAERFLSSGPIVFDQRVRVLAPASAEDQFFVPVTVDARGLRDVQEILVLTDLNPVAHALTFRPGKAEPFISFNVKLEQGSAIRAAARTRDGVWHLGGVLVDAAGGGCTAPAMAHGQADWMQTLGQTRAQAVREAGGDLRVTVRTRHPMDTGFANGIPAFYLSEVTVSGADGAPLAVIEPREPVSENPTFTLQMPDGAAGRELGFSARDTEGNTYGYRLPVPSGARVN